jgi:GMP synthase (glutamine-hydrolysing)|tara:strand:- start:37 stop:579 length:543 start_codon:yes stop_codon:yes gene_type:complete
MILIVNICKEGLHYYEFVKPIEDILRKGEVEFFTKSYLDIDEKDLKKAEKVIICGTSLKDEEFVKNSAEFSWVPDFDKPLLGICGGLQIISILNGGDLKKGEEIGFYLEKFKKPYLGLEDSVEVYHLHNNYIDFFWGREFEVFCGGAFIQAVKHKGREIYGVLFHPEVRNKKMILEFVRK